MAAFSQGSFPVISDVPSNIGSATATGLYFSMPFVDNRLRSAVNRFNAEYGKRTIYLTTSALIMGKINEEMGEAYLRYNTLQSRNNSLTFFVYSTKKNNKKMLETIGKMLTNLQLELLKQRPIVLLGEKVNLYINTTESLFEIHRLMDMVEDNINNTTLFRRLFY